MRSALLTPGDATELSPGAWTASTSTSPTSGVGIAPCREAGPASAAPGVERRLWRGPVGGYGVVSTVLRTPGTQGVTVLGGLEEQARRCPSAEEPANGEKDTYEVLSATSDRSQVVLRHTRRDCRECETATSVEVLVASGDAVAHVTLPAEELPRADRWADLALQRLRCGGPDCAALARERGFPAEASDVVQGATVWAVYLAVARDESQESEVAEAAEDVRRLGYTPATGQVGCDQGAAEGLGLPDGQYTAAAVYFDTQQLAQQFVDAYRPGVVGTVQITYFCAD